MVTYIIIGIVITLFALYKQAKILRKKKRSLWFLLINLLIGWLFAFIYIIFIVRSHEFDSDKKVDTESGEEI
jgi:energy-coupling factor transporter transmembrane protein EcfT